MHSLQIAAASLSILVCTGGLASAQSESETASLVRRPSRTISNTTGWMLEKGELQLDLGLDQEQRPTGSASVGLGDLAEFGLQLQHERSFCEGCEDVADDSVSVNIASAFFKMGTPEGLGHQHVPALALVFRKSLLRKAQVFTDTEKILSKSVHENRSAMLTAMASKTLGPTALHLGAELLVVEGTLMQGNFGVDDFVVRPAMGMQWTPSQYPLSTFLLDFRWVSEAVEESGSYEWDTRMTAAWGVRYQALDWAAVDLNVRRQDGEGLGDALVTLGVRGYFDLTGGKVAKKSGPKAE